MLITTAHARSIMGPNQKGYCAKGMRLFSDRHGLDFKAFCEGGIEEELLLATGDDMAVKVVAEAHKNG